MQPGEIRKREPARPPQKSTTSRTYGQQALGNLPSSLADPGLPLLARVVSNARVPHQRPALGSSGEADELAGTSEKLLIDTEGVPLLQRRDVWGLPLENRGMGYGDERKAQ